MSASLAAARAERLKSAIADAGLDAVAVVPGANFYYLTGVHLHLMERPTVLFVGADGRKAAVIPALERARWQAEVPDVDTVYWQDSDGYEAAFAKVAKRFRATRLGVEGQRMRFFEAEVVRRTFANTLVTDAHSEISAIRLCKDAAEVAAMRRAIEISERAWLATMDQVRQSYRRLMRMYHPDKHTDNADKQRIATEITQKLTEAFMKIREFHGVK